MNYAIILAAGKGTRMKSDMPKCAYPLLKKPMIKYILDSLKNTAVDEIITIVGHQREVFAEMLKGSVTFAFQEEQLGTGHAVLQAKPHINNLNGHSLILCGDMPLISDEMLRDLLDYHIVNNNDITVVSTIMDDPFSYGRIIRDSNGDLQKIIEEKEADAKQKAIKEINTGLYCVKNDILFKLLEQVDDNNIKGEYYLTDIVRLAKLENKKVEVYRGSNSKMFIGINDLYTLSIVEDHLRKQINKKHMLNGVCIVNPGSVIIGDDVVIAPGAIIHANTYLTGNTIIKDGCVIGPNSEIHNSEIGERTSVIHSLICDSRIGKDGTVGPFTHIRMHADLGDRIRAGNFIEVKNSNVADDTKMSHLSYIGDTDCGSNVNWGCGCVTVNYDGAKKHRTIIGNNVFIGCNTNLIAPITIGDDVMIAAGSTLTDSVPNEAFAIARARQVTKEKYARKYNFKKK